MRIIRVPTIIMSIKSTNTESLELCQAHNTILINIEILLNIKIL